MYKLECFLHCYNASIARIVDQFGILNFDKQLRIVTDDQIITYS